jgi:hypothetical protein
LSDVETVFIVGAGASREFGLPTGEELTELISTILSIKFEEGRLYESEQYRTFEALDAMLRQDTVANNIKGNPYLHAGWAIRDNMFLAPSIDNYLDTHRSDRYIVSTGKVAIATAIQHAEKESILFGNDRWTGFSINNRE